MAGFPLPMIGLLRWPGLYLERIIMQAKYIGCSGTQYNYGGGDDPREDLIVGEVYEFNHREVHDWVTFLHINGKRYNSVCFEEMATRSLSKGTRT